MGVKEREKRNVDVLLWIYAKIGSSWLVGIGTGKWIHITHIETWYSILYKLWVRTNTGVMD